MVKQTIDDEKNINPLAHLVHLQKWLHKIIYSDHDMKLSSTSAWPLYHHCSCYLETRIVILFYIKQIDFWKQYILPELQIFAPICFLVLIGRFGSEVFWQWGIFIIGGTLDKISTSHSKDDTIFISARWCNRNRVALNSIKTLVRQVKGTEKHEISLDLKHRHDKKYVFIKAGSTDPENLFFVCNSCSSWFTQGVFIWRLSLSSNLFTS